ncbi:MAG: GxxExxY protein [Desulfobacterales bacterium]|nr:GxxExxY protein [Desulfobacterales bacterium]MBI9085433.1 GxxExxY protein [Desulfobacterales bacterium]
MEIENIAKKIVHSAIKVHKILGPGLLESAYQKCIAYELDRAGLQIRCEVALPIQYMEMSIDAGFRVDMIVNDAVIIENKVVDRISPVHKAQLLTYLKLADLKLGFLLNWNVTLMKDGIQRMVYRLEQGHRDPWKES